MDINFQEEIAKIFKECGVQTTREFNIFSALHVPHDERRLHSRFISYLLSPESAHQQKDLFLTEFLKTIGIADFNTTRAEVIPNEYNKSEYQNMDIYIQNGKQTIIIENKIYAKDSNLVNEENEVVPQLINYYNKVKNEFNFSDSEALQNIHLVYLTLDGKKPSYFEKFTELGLKLTCVDYIKQVQLWLEGCLKVTNDNHLKSAIEQYRGLLHHLTNDIKLTMKLKELISANRVAAWEFLQKDITDANLLKQQMIHVKWHTVHEFWHELSIKLQNLFKVEVYLPDDDLITKTTHRDYKRGTALHFFYKDKFIYVSNDRKGFTWGIEKEWWHFEFEYSKEIIFFDFNKKETFNMINKDYRNEVIQRIVEELKIS